MWHGRLESWLCSLLCYFGQFLWPPWASVSSPVKWGLCCCCCCFSFPSPFLLSQLLLFLLFKERATCLRPHDPGEGGRRRAFSGLFWDVSYYRGHTACGNDSMGCSEHNTQSSCSSCISASGRNRWLFCPSGWAPNTRWCLSGCCFLKEAGRFPLSLHKNQVQLVRQDTLLILDFGSDIFDSVTELDLKGDGLACQGLLKDPHHRVLVKAKEQVYAS